MFIRIKAILGKSITCSTTVQMMINGNLIHVLTTNLTVKAEVLKQSV